MLNMKEELKSIITDKILKKAVANQLKWHNPDDIEIVSCETKSLTTVGDGFSSSIKAVDVKVLVGGARKEVNFVAKMSPKDNSGWSAGIQEQIDDIERMFYEKIANELQHIRKSASLQPITIPEAHYVSRTEGIIILDNLQLEGFRCLKRGAKGMDVEDLHSSLKALAEYHATTYHFIQTYPGGVDKFMDGNPCMKPSTLFELGKAQSKAQGKAQGTAQVKSNFFDNLLKNIAKLTTHVAKHPNLADKLRAQIPIWRDKVIDGSHPETNDFQTIIHGDAWQNNILFRSGNDISDKGLKLLDFQMSNYNAPALDLTYLMHSSTFPATRKLHSECWLRFYHTMMVQNLMAYGYPESTYTFEELKRTFRKLRYFGFFSEMLHLSLLLINPKTAKETDMDKTDGVGVAEKLRKVNDNMLTNAQMTPFFVERVVDALTMAEENGLI